MKDSFFDFLIKVVMSLMLVGPFFLTFMECMMVMAYTITKDPVCIPILKGGFVALVISIICRVLVEDM